MGQFSSSNHSTRPGPRAFPRPPATPHSPPDHAGNLLGLVLSPLLLAAFGWRGLFCIFGALGLPLLLFWLRVVPDAAPARHAPAAATTSSSSTTAPAPGQPSGQSAPPAAAGPGAGPAGVSISAAQLMSKPATWAIIVVNVVNHWGYFIYLNWMPSYFNKVTGCPPHAGDKGGGGRGQAGRQAKGTSHPHSA